MTGKSEVRTAVFSQNFECRECGHQFDIPYGGLCPMCGASNWKNRKRQPKQVPGQITLFEE